jgi:plastocyanin
MRTLWRSFGLLTLLTVTGIAAASADGPQADRVAQAVSPPREAGPAVTTRVFQFQPGQLDVKSGTQVTWTNQDDIEHTVTSGTPESPDGRFNSRLSGKGTTFSFTFAQPVTYSYLCNRHPSMRGHVRVN